MQPPVVHREFTCSARMFRAHVPRACSARHVPRMIDLSFDKHRLPRIFRGRLPRPLFYLGILDLRVVIRGHLTRTFLLITFLFDNLL